VCAGGAENMPTLVAALGVGFVPTGACTAYVVLTDENIDVCCSGGVGYREQNIGLVKATAIKII